jgi:hypothetical protein
VSGGSHAFGVEAAFVVPAQLVGDQHPSGRPAWFALKGFDMHKSPISAAIGRYEAKAPVVIPFRDSADVSHVGLEAIARIKPRREAAWA